MRRNRELFASLVDHEKFVSNRGNRQFTTNPGELRSPSKIDDKLFTEINLSANGLRDVIRNLLDVFEIPRENLQIFLREDRDADTR